MRPLLLFPVAGLIVWLILFIGYRLAISGEYQERMECYPGGRGGIIKVVDFRTRSKLLDKVYYLPSRLELLVRVPAIKRLSADELVCPSEPPDNPRRESHRA